MLDYPFHIKLNELSMPKFDTNEPERIHFIVEIPIQEAFINDETDQVKELKNNEIIKNNTTKK